MSTKTITVTEIAYESLKSMKAKNESFSDTILRITKRKPLSYFYGILDNETGEKLEKSIMENRRKNRKLHEKRLKRIEEEMNS